MHGKLKTWITIAATVLLASCATHPSISLESQAKQKIKRIALVETPEPEQYMLYPGVAPGGMALYMFGAIGGAILGGIEASRMEAASEKFTAALAPFRPELKARFRNVVESGLRAKGYEVHRVPAPPARADGEGYDLARLEGGFDAYLVAEFRGGYSSDWGGPAAPQMIVVVSLTGRAGEPRYFMQGYAYGRRTLGDYVQIAPEDRFTMPSPDATYGNGGVAAEALQAGATAIATHVVSQF